MVNFLQDCRDKVSSTVLKQLDNFWIAAVLTFWLSKDFSFVIEMRNKNGKKCEA